MKLKTFIPNAFVTSLFCLLSLLFCTKSQLMLGDTDFWWHLASGDAYKIGNSPYSDIFSFTTKNYPWFGSSWLWDIIYGWLNRTSSIYLPVVVTAIIYALTLSILAGFLLKRAGPVITIFVILFCVVPYSYMLTPRPHQITYLMAVLFYTICDKVFENKRSINLSVLPFLMILWINMHAGFFIGLMITGGYFFQSVAVRDKKLSFSFFIISIIILAFTLINPLGINFYYIFYNTLYTPAISMVSEWQPIQFEKKFLFHWIYIMFFVISFRLDNKTGLAEKLLSVFWLISAIRFERNLPIFVILSAPVMAANIKTWTKIIPLRMQGILQRKDAGYTKDFNNPKPRKVTFIIAIFIAVLLLFGLARPYLSLTTPNDKPQLEAEFIKQHYPDKNFLNDYFQGGYILYICRGTPRIFIDGRGTFAYPSEVVGDYLKFHYGQPGWEEMLDKYDIDGAILPKDNPNLSYFAANTRWKQVFAGNLDVIYIRQK